MATPQQIIETYGTTNQQTTLKYYLQQIQYQKVKQEKMRADYLKKTNSGLFRRQKELEILLERYAQWMGYDEETVSSIQQAGFEDYLSLHLAHLESLPKTLLMKERIKEKQKEIDLWKEKREKQLLCHLEEFNIKISRRLLEIEALAKKVMR